MNVEISNVNCIFALKNSLSIINNFFNCSFIFTNTKIKKPKFLVLKD